MSLRITSPAFGSGDDIPRRHTCDGEDVSPRLSIGGVPDGAERLALVVDDPDAPAGTWVHWVLSGVPADVGRIPEDVPADEMVLDGAVQGRNDFGSLGYGGPCPPEGEEHRYFFRLYALEGRPDVDAGCTREELREAMEPLIVAEADLMGRYERR